MGRSQRVKGATFEREVARLFTVALGRDVRRHLGQARDGGEDIDARPFVVECKRRKSLKTLYGWFSQVVRALPDQSRVPVVVLRADSEEALALVRVKDFLALVEVVRRTRPGDLELLVQTGDSVVRRAAERPGAAE